MCVQEQALKLFKRTYVLGDPQKLEDFTVAMKALKEVSRTLSSELVTQHASSCQLVVGCAQCMQLIHSMLSTAVQHGWAKSSEQFTGCWGLMRA